MKIIVDEYGETVRPWETVMTIRGTWMTITDLDPEDERFQIGAVFEGGDPEEDGDYYAAEFFNFKVIEVQ